LSFDRLRLNHGGTAGEAGERELATDKAKLPRMWQTRQARPPRKSETLVH
jgi:hypothetical protein